VRASTAYVHPRVLGATSNLPWQMSLTFLVSLTGMALLYVTLCKYELTAKHTRAQLRALRRLAERRAGTASAAPLRRGRSAAPSLQATAMTAHPADRSLHEAGKYVAGAYIVLFAMVLVYVAIMAIRLSHLERDLGELLAREQADVDAETNAQARESTLV
jgi:hypothetical protein